MFSDALKNSHAIGCLLTRDIPEETFPKKAPEIEKKASKKRQDSGGSSKMHREATTASDSHGLSGG